MNKKCIWGFVDGKTIYYGEGETIEEARKDLPAIMQGVPLVPLPSLDMYLQHTITLNEDGDRRYTTQ